MEIFLKRRKVDSCICKTRGKPYFVSYLSNTSVLQAETQDNKGDQKPWMAAEALPGN